MFEEYLWGEVPAGFRKLSPSRKQVVLIREGLEGCVSADLLFGPKEAEEGSSLLKGRGKVRLLQLGDGESAVVRKYRHGGVFRHLTGDLFFTWPPRPFTELAMTAEASRRGVPTLEVLGAFVERVAGPIYRGWLATRRLKGGRDLWDALRSGAYPGDEGTALLRAVARSIMRMHQQGIYHRDLNLKNIMIRDEQGQITVYIIDFDKARFFPGEVPAHRARRNLDRLLRSARKLDPGLRHLSHEAWNLLIDFYREAAQR